MTKRQRHQLDAAQRVRQYGLDRPLTPANAAATAAYTALEGAIARVHLLDRQRLHGTATSAGATEERLLIRRRLRSALSDLSRVARTPGLAAAHPDLAAQLRMGRVDSNSDLLAYANNAIKVIEPVKEIFIAHGAAPTFLQEIATLIESFIAAGDRGHSGRSTRLGSNAELQAAIRAMMHQIHILDAIHSIILKPHPGLLAEWQATRRVRRTSIPAEPEPAPAAQSAVDALIPAPAPSFIGAASSSSAPPAGRVIPYRPATRQTSPENNLTSCQHERDSKSQNILASARRPNAPNKIPAIPNLHPALRSPGSNDSLFIDIT